MQVLDKGSIELVEVMGTDKTVVNAARVSFAHADWMEKLCNARDEKLIGYLAEHGHVSPFYHPHLMFVVKAPISVQRQWFKHKIGTAENSESTRYTEVKDEFYVPETFRAQSKDNKQGSNGVVLGQFDCLAHYQTAAFTAFEAYEALLGFGVAKEQAREILPLCTYTSWVWTASLAAVAHFLKLRDDDHAQFEIREYAKAMRLLAQEHFPVSIAALGDYA